MRPTRAHLDMADETVVVERARSGDASAFAALYTECRPAVEQVVGAIVRDRDQVADSVQEAFTRALDRLPTLRDAARFRPWLLSIARHVATDQVRARVKARTTAEDEALELAAPDPGPEELAELAELSRLVRAGVAGLSRRDAAAVALVTNLGLTPSEVAVALGITPGAAKVVVHRARRRLRDALAADLQSPSVAAPPGG